MKFFLSDLHKITKRRKRKTGLMLLFDFDGTLSEIVAHPSKAVFIKGWRKRLIDLKRRNNVTIGIVTGRSLQDIRKRVGIPGIIYAASHGYDINKGSRPLLRLGKEHRRPLAKLAHALGRQLQPITGAEIEFKGCSVAVHYRRVCPSLRAKVKKTVDTVAKPLLRRHGWQLTGGKMVIEVRPAEKWNKGRATHWIWKNVAPSSIPCYIGDDVTDEDAFQALGKMGITIRIGKKKNSCAEYYVNHINDLNVWLERI